MLSGCATTSNLPPPLTVDLSALSTCEEILKDVQLPPISAKDDARVAFIKDDAALIESRGRMAAGRGCVGDVRTKYQGTGK